MKRIFLYFVSLGLAAQITPTTITGPVSTSVGGTFSGQVQITAPDLICAGARYARWSKKFTLTAGAFDTSPTLYPTDACKPTSPGGVGAYTWTFVGADGSRYTLYFGVPSSASPVTFSGLAQLSADGVPWTGPVTSINGAAGAITLAPVAATGRYSDLTGSPAIHAVPTTTAILKGDGAGGMTPSPITDDGTTVNFTGRNVSVQNTVLPLPNEITITAPAYAASGSAVQTTGTFAVGTTGTVASCASFQAGNGVYIAGAGAAAVNYIGTVASCSGTAMAVNPATSTSVSGAKVQHDETAAFQSAITALSGLNGKIVVPDGFYRLNGPLQDTLGANSILLLPDIRSDVTATPGASLEITGSTTAFPAYTIGLSTVPSTTGSILQTDGTSGNLIGGYGYNGYLGGHITIISLIVKNITLRAYPNPSITMINANRLANLYMEGVSIDAFGTAARVQPSTPTNQNGVGVVMPTVGNWAQQDIRNLAVFGFYAGLVLNEHANVDNLMFNYTKIGIVNSVQGHAARVGRMLCQGCVYAITSGNTIPTTGALNLTNPNGAYEQGVVTVEELELEHEGNQVYDIYDPLGAMRGTINYSYQTKNTHTVTGLSVMGGSNLTVNPIYVTDSPGLIAHGCYNLGTNGGTTSALDTTGANFIVVGRAYDTGGTATLTDSVGNSYTNVGGAGSFPVLKIDYTEAAAVTSASHTWTLTGSASNASICIEAWSGMIQPTGLDAGKFSFATQSGLHTGQPGSITPTLGTRLVVSVGGFAPLSGDSFTVNLLNNVDTAPHATLYGIGMGSVVQANTAINPTWTAVRSTIVTAGIAAFDVLGPYGFTRSR